MSRYVCVHGHFYQPPRENPWLEAIEQQDSAYPFHDWNERITAECYSTNGRSRILDEQGWIVKIVNNYARMSFNFGPTLLSWLEMHAPDAYAALLEADRLSLHRFDGHGSAMAQGYGHIIMPLANARDQRTQVIWGIEDFRRRFQRDPEGMWLPEAAVDLDCLELLAEFGVKFTVLAPRQAKRWRARGEKAWTEGNGDAIDPSKPYLQRLPSGREITLFFYDGPISQGVAFEGLLNSGVAFANRIKDAFSEKREGVQLAHIATDGETYGHHHRFGDMALAFALNHIEGDEGVTLTNYGKFMDEHPAEHEVEIHENSSWSCYHGVERWRADCGCASGMNPTWNQKWRAPLRDSLDWLRDKLAPLYEKAAEDLLKDPWKARDAYIQLILDRSDESVDRFFSEHAARSLDEAERIRALELLEMQRHAMLMYTSCGWFFDDLSGIETVQVIQYAGRAIQLAKDTLGEDLEEGYLERLQAARSNIERKGNGRDVYYSSVRPAFVDLPKVAAHSAISALFEEEVEGERDVYCYRATLTTDRDLRAGRAHLCIGKAALTSRITRESGEVRFAVVHLGDHVVTGAVGNFETEQGYQDFLQSAEDSFQAADFVNLLRQIEDAFGGSTYSLGSLFRDEQRRIVERVLEPALQDVQALHQSIFERNAPLLRFHSNLHIPAPRELLISAEFVMNEQLRQAIAEAPADLDHIEQLRKEAEADNVPLDEVTLAFFAEQTLERLAESLRESPGSLDRLQALRDTVATIDRLEFEIDLEGVQNVFYELISAARPSMAGGADSSTEAAEWVKTFDDLGALLRVRVPS